MHIVKCNIFIALKQWKIKMYMCRKSLFSLTYILIIISKFDNSIKNTFINSILMSIQSISYTIIMFTYEYVL